MTTTPSPIAPPGPAAAPDAQALADVGVLLTRAGLTVREPETALLAAGYEAQNAGVALLYAVSEARYVDPALRFRADARIVDWAD
ncbi:hypothetical protein [Actinoallomurus soli]|uniref:hypothetical protein n=1 Tax=Actinoallomurus soli TaxID=2952535 RepID=UPI002093BDE1|nr:hypothetical protein [Actinoallomurus soli]MCO5972825.1 hypothetical protein [Actinoallomurus soli]